MGIDFLGDYRTSMFRSPFHLGVLGGGQLGRMLIPAALKLNVHLRFLDREGATCQQSSPNFQVGLVTNTQDILDFAAGCDAITIEIENVSVEALEKLEREGLSVHPSAEIVALSQNKLEQKNFIRNNGFPTAEYRVVDGQEDIVAAEMKFPVVQKLQKTGYDGRGVVILNKASDLEQAFLAPSILEDKIDFEKELAVIVARDNKGNLVAYPPVEMSFSPSQNILEYLFCPAQIEAKMAKQVQEMALELANSLKIVGLLAVEMFLTKDNQLLINEIAPRPHNSGHYSIDACIVSQFEQHLRAVCDLPLVQPLLRSYVAIVNILGSPQGTINLGDDDIEKILKMSGVFLHSYGKRGVRPFRKMGHIAIVGQDYEEMQKKLQRVRAMAF